MDASTKEDRIQDFKRICRERGERFTVQRRIILETVLDLDNHPSADRIYDAVESRLPGIARTTVYRTLEHLVPHGDHHQGLPPGQGRPISTRAPKSTTTWCACDCNEFIDFEDDGLNQLRDPGHVRIRLRRQRLPRTDSGDYVNTAEKTREKEDSK